jgi:predicted transcriptional regulator
MTTNALPGNKDVPDLELIKRFQVDYNAVDHWLRTALCKEPSVSFRNLVDEYLTAHPSWPDAELLRRVARLRNAIVHGETEPDNFVAIPRPRIVQALHDCRTRLEDPVLVIPKFQRSVETVSFDHTLARVLKILRQRDYSQFPVYEAGQFRGLLTENGITRWLAHHVSTRLSLVEFEDVSVAQVLLDEEKRGTVDFAAQDVRLYDVSGKFVSQPMLEAVLITPNGKDSEQLIGIATRWDMLHLK